MLRLHRAADDVCPTNVAKYDAILSRSHLDVGLDVSKIMRSQSEGRRLLHQLEITCRSMNILQWNTHGSNAAFFKNTCKPAVDLIHRKKQD